MRTLEDFRDLEAVMGLLRDVIDSRALSPAVLESRLGWAPGKVSEWLSKPYEARVVDYIRVLRLAVSPSVEPEEPGEEVEPAEPELLESMLYAEAHRDGVEPVAPQFAPEADPDDAPPAPIRHLRLTDLHFTAILTLIANGSLSATEVLDSIRIYKRQIRQLAEH